MDRALPHVALPLALVLLATFLLAPASAAPVCAGRVCFTAPTSTPTFVHCTLYTWESVPHAPTYAAYCNLSQGGWLNMTGGGGAQPFIVCGFGTLSNGCMGYWPIPWMLP